MQQVTLDLIAALVTEGLFTIGDLAGTNSRFVPWSTMLEESFRRIRDAYIDGHGQPDHWSWFCWLDLST